MSENAPTLDASTLSHLMQVVSTLSELPTEQTMAEFVSNALLSVPGVSGAAVELGSGSARAGAEPSEGGCAWRGPLAFAGRAHGQLELVVDADADFAAYAPFVRTLSQSLAGQAALREAHRRANAAQEELQRILANLELRVGERTSELLAANEQLRLQAAVFAHAMEGIIITDQDENILSVNPAFTETTGYTFEDVLRSPDRTPRLLRSGRHDGAFYTAMWAELRDRGAWAGEVWNRRRSGEVFPEWLRIRAIYDQGGKVAYYVGHFTDLSERKVIEGRLDFLARHDALTGLLNRQGLGEQFPLARERAASAREFVALVLIDLDHFKLVNDTLGHEAGDRLLVDVAHRLRAALPATHTLSRHSGDEFVVLSPSLPSAEHAADTVERLLDALRTYGALSGAGLTVSASAGVALCPSDGTEFEELLKRADLALHAAKGAGRDTLEFYSDLLDADGARRFRLLRLLRGAEERGELDVHYQLQVDLATGATLGAEALARWTPPELGPVSPAEFIPLAETHGLINRLGGWVFRSACAQLAEWRATGLDDLAVAINLSAIQFRRPDLANALIELVQAAGVPPHAVELELTESILIQNPEAALQTCARLKDHGFRLSIDDFGTGYSSLAYLQRLPVDKLKIDKSFVTGLGDGTTGLAIPRAIVEMGHSLGIQVIAEGVEDAATADVLRSIGCDQGQGYFFSRPLPAPRFASLIRSRLQAEAK